MGDSDPLMRSMLLACVVLLVVPVTILGIAVYWYLRGRAGEHQTSDVGPEA